MATPNVGGNPMAIYRLFGEGSFAPDEIIIMSSAYEDVLHQLQLADRTNPFAEKIAKKIIELCQRGLRDPARICSTALAELDIKRPPVWPEAMSKYRTTLKEFLSDSLQFMSEQLALDVDLADRTAAIEAAAGAIPFIKDRLQEDYFLKTKFMLLFGNYMFHAEWQNNWKKLASEPRGQSARKLSELREIVAQAIRIVA
jgi:hypothetical protein